MGNPFTGPVTYPLLVGSGASHRCLVNEDTAGWWTEGWREGWAGAQPVGMVTLRCLLYSSNFYIIAKESWASLSASLHCILCRGFLICEIEIHTLPCPGKLEDGRDFLSVF